MRPLQRVAPGQRILPGGTFNTLVDEAEARRRELATLEDTRGPQSRSPVHVTLAWNGDEPLAPGRAVRLLTPLAHPEVDGGAPLGGLAFRAAPLAAGDELGGCAIALGPIAARTTADGTLSTRTDDDTGTLTMDSSGHGLVDGQVVDIEWLEEDVPKRRDGMTVGTVADTSVPIAGGQGDPLPPTSTEIVVVKTYAVGAGVLPEAYWAKVNLTSAAHTRAVAAAGTLLASASAGGAAILWRPAGTGERWCVLALAGPGGGGAAAGISVVIDATIPAADIVEPQVTVDWEQLTTSTGTLIFSDGLHGYQEGDVLDLTWAGAGGWRNRRTGVVVGTITVASEVPISGGTGDDLPADDTEIHVGPLFVRPVSVGLKKLTGNDLRPIPGSQLSATLTTRIGDHQGVLTMSSSTHGLLVLEEIFLFWSGTNYTRARITDVSGDAVSFDASDDDVLPAESTSITVTHYEAVEVAHYWPEPISPGTSKALLARCWEREDGTLELLVWSCKATDAFLHPALPPEA